MDKSDVIKKGRKRSDNWHARFLADFKQYGNTTHAASVANIPRSTVYQHQSTNKDFAEKCDVAYAMFIASHEVILVDHSRNGNLLATLALLRANAPDKYRDSNGQQQTITHDYIIEIGTPRAITTSNADTAQDVTPQRVHDTTGNVLE